MRNKGFTLIELMIALAILAIVIGIAVPSYNNQITKTRRAEGKAAIMDAAQGLERCFTRYSAYNAGNCGVSFPITSEEGWYIVTAPTLTATTYTLTATPQNGQATSDTDCANLSLTHTGSKSISGSGTVDDCW